MKINVTKSSIPPFNEYCKEISSIWENSWLTNSGPKHQVLEEKLKEFFDVENVTLFTNGHLALEAALEVFDFPRGSEVITTPFTFVSTSNAIVRKGLVPVFCDIDSKNYTIDVNKIEPLITSKTVAILPVHVYGNVCDVEAIDKIAKKHNLKVIYDAAHAFGVEFKGKSIASYGDISMFSFHATKVFNTVEGGCLCFKDRDLKTKLENSKNFGIYDEEKCSLIGCNAKMNEFQAAMGICNLRHFKEYIEGRKRVVEEYHKHLSYIDGVILCNKQDQIKTNYAYFPVVFKSEEERDKVKKNLSEKGIFARKYFYPLITRLECYKDFINCKTPVAESISARVLTLPLYPELTAKQISEICDLIKASLLK